MTSKKFLIVVNIKKILNKKYRWKKKKLLYVVFFLLFILHSCCETRYFKLQNKRKKRPQNLICFETVKYNFLKLQIFLAQKRCHLNVVIFFFLCLVFQLYRQPGNWNLKTRVRRKMCAKRLKCESEIQKIFLYVIVNINIFFNKNTSSTRMVPWTTTYLYH